MKTKHGSGQLLLPSFPQENTHDLQDQETKFDLYVQSRKVKQIVSSLERFLSELQRTHPNWLANNQEFMTFLLDELLNDSLLVLDGMELDAEGIRMSLSLMSDIRQALSVVEQLASEEGEGLN